ncbi:MULTISPECIES: hypothetical protein [unclassified Streptomyces]|uniref:hypothetical protein n=1 Tax=unclassified Streptomyces TaxID=2593676 RepID=UPI000C26F732|nr:hypothetical protein [Streptomyces sp. CB01373]PJM93864.1 hypothetical protein CG719_20375 [Streptomyces sp. CB01373]
MRIRRILAAVIATAALAGLGLTGAAATATAAASPTPGECEQGGGTVNWANNTCKGGTYDGQMVD